MSTYTPPPYFPQNSLSPPEPHKFRKFKLMVAGVVLAALVVVAVLGVALFWVFSTFRR